MLEIYALTYSVLLAFSVQEVGGQKVRDIMLRNPRNFKLRGSTRAVGRSEGVRTVVRTQKKGKEIKIEKEPCVRTEFAGSSEAIDSSKENSEVKFE
jgi:hypothetical protein